jgi:hypothetical protein
LIAICTTAASSTQEVPRWLGQAINASEQRELHIKRQLGRPPPRTEPSERVRDDSKFHRLEIDAFLFQDRCDFTDAACGAWPVEVTQEPGSIAVGSADPCTRADVFSKELALFIGWQEDFESPLPYFCYHSFSLVVVSGGAHDSVCFTASFIG